MKINNELVIDANEYVVKAVQILAKKRSGKSYTASKIAEELLKEDIPIVIIDPISAHWGLKEKFDILVFGRDIPLPEADRASIIEQGEIIGRLIATSKYSAIIDLNEWSEHHQQLFAQHFFKILYKENQNRRHVFVEEADIFAPQIAQIGDEVLKCRHALDNLVRRGGAKGLGTTVITQRPALVSKNILTQSDLTIALNIQAASDLKAFADIIKDDEEFTKEDFAKIKNKIKTAERGLAYFYSPQWLGFRDFIKVGKKETYHAGSTLGDPDYIPSDSVKLQTALNLDDVKQKLASLVTALPKAEGKKAPAGIDMSQYIPIAEHEKVKDTLREKNKTIVEQKEKLLNFEVLKEALISCLGFEEVQLTDEQRDNSVEVQTNVKENITETKIIQSLKQEEFNETSIEGKIIIMISEGYFDKATDIESIHKEIDRLWEIGETEKPNKPNAKRYKRRLELVLQKLARKPYQYLKEETDMWISDKNNIQRIQVINNK